jgi:tRNA U34 5-carboxymethylaminomethyl modifying GTPase MnmE/TrmE
VFQVLTGGHAAAISVVRLSGPRVPAFLRAHFRGRTDSTPAAGDVLHGALLDGDGAEADDVLLSIHATGPVDARFHLHGNPWLVHRFCEWAQVAGFAPADAPSGVEWFLTPIRIVLLGPPNVGKSTLFNALAGEAVSIVSAVPGTTRDWVEQPADIAGMPVVWVDTAGIRPTPDALEAASADDDLARPANGKTVRILNKVDLIPRRELRRIRPTCCPPPPVLVSGLRGWGLRRLRREILRSLGRNPDRLAQPGPFTTRQCCALESLIHCGDEHTKVTAVRYIIGL